MTKFLKLIKFIFKLFIGLIVLGLIFNYGFKLKEYFAGKHYVEYWENHPNQIEQVEQNNEFDFKILEQIASDNNLILFGESHGTKEAQKIDLQLVKYLNRTAGMKYHLVELDFSQAHYINEYLKTGNDLLVNYALKNWAVVAGRENKDYYNKWFNLFKFNQALPDSQRIQVIGIDQINDFAITRDHLTRIFESLNINIEIPVEKKEIVEWSKMELPNIIENNKDSIDSLALYSLEHIKFNLQEYFDKTRPELMFANFEKQFKSCELENQKLYGYFGMAHVLKSEMNGYDDFAATLKKSDLPIKNKVFSIVTMFSDSKWGIPSAYLPAPIQGEKRLTKIPISYDSPTLMYFYGVTDLKRVTKENTNTLFILNDEQSPYSQSLRLVDNFGLIPRGMEITLNESVTTDYFDAVLLIRNSDWAEPY
tara:strand:- start:1686 stop:2951 length:1266 start_codon:yes stop_codon:yes gene_type:complete